ncbi:hypothetical protein B0I33_102274 [Prauserella shujinwangii]|uniref:YdhG-like domain-containing protein n=1 Tax=Prauserella shujinwangii TaxID=1453103 RepID=A0A2T0M0N5_9PSEU|nr:DUF1801 domain-containing protein [Prauserella shujinwangii]PRX50155.1 hypothetical protein B0I33_102274 [Prauserella shujinwangii]
MPRHTTVAEYVTALDSPLREVAGKLVPIIEAALPDAPGALWHGHPVWGTGPKPGAAPICLLKAYSSSVTFGLWHGQAVADPSGRLEPGAREMAGVKLADVADIDGELFTGWLRQARALANPS